MFPLLSLIAQNQVGRDSWIQYDFVRLQAPVACVAIESINKNQPLYCLFTFSKNQHALVLGFTSDALPFINYIFK